MTTLRDFCSEIQLTATVTPTQLIYTGPSEKFYLGQFTLTNTSSSNAVVTLWRVSTSTTETTGSGGNWLTKVRVPPGGRPVIVKELLGHVLGNSMEISYLVDVASVVNVDISGNSVP